MLLKRLLTSITFFVAAITGVVTLSLVKTTLYPARSRAAGCRGSHDLHLNTKRWSYINVTIKPIGGTRDRLENKGQLANDEPWDFYTGTGRGDIIRDIDGLNGVINDSGYIIESQGLTYVSFRLNSTLRSSFRQVVAVNVNIIREHM